MKVLYFASLREALGACEEMPAAESVGALVESIRARGGKWRQALSGPFRVAVNQEMAEMDTPIGEGDEVAIFPPVTGG